MGPGPKSEAAELGPEPLVIYRPHPWAPLPVGHVRINPTAEAVKGYFGGP